MTTTITEGRETALAAARRLAPELEERAAEGESLRTMPADLVEKVKAAGLFRLALPRSLGGLELDPVSIIETVEELSRADGSGGWTVLIGNSTAFVAWLDPDVAKDLIGGNPEFASTSMFGPMGTAVPDGDGTMTINGRWPFNSGCPHSEIFQTGVFVFEDGSPRIIPGRGPDWRFAFFRRDGGEIIDTWNSIGLRGTGSHDVVVSNLRLPEDQLAAPLFDPPRHDGLLYRMPFFALAGVVMSGFPLGVARRALDEFTRAIKGKIRGAATATVAHDEFVQVELAKAEARVQSARSFVFDVVGDMWTTLEAGDDLGLGQRARWQLAVKNGLDSAVAAVQAVFPLGGASGVFSGQPLERCLRDLQVASTHMYFHADGYKRFAQERLGILEPTPML